MLSPKLTKKLIQDSLAVNAAKRELQELAGAILHASKRSIFAYHRDDQKQAQLLLQQARQSLKQGWGLVKKQSKLAHEGIWRAAQEEFAEASLLDQYLIKQTIGVIPEISEDPDIYLGGLSDLTGELTRKAVMLAADRKEKEVNKIFEDVRQIIDFLLEMDLTGSLRTKVDQAKSNLRKLEEIRYDLAIRAIK